MDDLTSLLLSRRFIIALAIIGAVVSVIGGALMRKGSGVPPGRARLIMGGGYGITAASVVAFIVAGFLADE